MCLKDPGEAHSDSQNSCSPLASCSRCTRVPCVQISGDPRPKKIALTFKVAKRFKDRGLQAGSGPHSVSVFKRVSELSQLCAAEVKQSKRKSKFGGGGRGVEAKRAKEQVPALPRGPSQGSGSTSPVRLEGPAQQPQELGHASAPAWSISRGEWY